jgi:hypothetical protein
VSSSGDPESEEESVEPLLSVDPDVFESELSHVSQGVLGESPSAGDPVVLGDEGDSDEVGVSVPLGDPEEGEEGVELPEALGVPVAAGDPEEGEEGVELPEALGVPVAPGVHV